MTDHWVRRDFEDCLEPIRYTRKIQKADFAAEGDFPIVSQEADFINGYWNDLGDVFKVDKPVIAFGDHTQVIKYIDFDFVLGADGVKLLKPNADLDSKYFYYYLLAHPLKTIGYARHYRLLKELKISYPAILEQRRIVTLLDEMFETIETATAKAEKNIANAQAIFSEQLRSEFGDLIRRYGEISLGEIAATISDGDHQPPPKASEGVPFITISDIDKGTHQIDFTDTFKVPEFYYFALKPNRKPIKGDVLYTVTGSFGIPVLIDTDTRFCLQRHIALVRPTPNVNSEWLYYLLLSPLVFEQSNAGATGTAQKTVSLAILRGIKVPMLPLEAQCQMVDRLRTLRLSAVELTSVYQQKLKLLAELKRSIFALAFSGGLPSVPSDVLDAAAE